MGEHFRQPVDGALEDVGIRRGLSYDECSLLARLVLMAYWRTGTVHGSATYLAERLGIGRNRLVRLLDALAEAGVIHRDHPRGHEGSVTVLGWAELVRVPDAVAEALASRNSHIDASDQDKHEHVSAQVPERRERPAQIHNSHIDASATRATEAITADSTRAQRERPGNRVYASRERSSGFPVAGGDEEGDAVGGHALSACSGSGPAGVCGVRDGIREWSDGNWYCRPCEPMQGQPVEGIPSWC